MALKDHHLLNIPTKASKDDSWIQWYKDLKKEFGKKTANSLWIFAWSKRGGANSDANTVNLRNYMESKAGITLDKSWTASLTDTSLDAFDSITDFLSVGKTVAIVVLVALGIPVAMLLYQIARDPHRSVDSLVKARTLGLAK